jgi:hypothetical protein
MRSRASFSASSAARSQAAALEIDAVEFLAERDQRLVAAGHDLRDDRSHRLLDVLGSLALGRKESGKPIGEIGVARVEPQRHGEPLG